jgi:hypothetical protein
MKEEGGRRKEEGGRRKEEGWVVASCGRLVSNVSFGYGA